MEDFPALQALIDFYVNEDIYFNYSDLSEALADFAARRPTAAAAVGVEIETLLRSTDSDHELEAALDDFGIGVEPGSNGSTDYRQWLLTVSQEVGQLIAWHERRS